MGPGGPSLSELKARKKAEEEAALQASNPEPMETTTTTAPSTTRKRSDTGGRMTHLTLDRPDKKKRRPLSKKPSEIMSLIGILISLCILTHKALTMVLAKSSRHQKGQPKN